MLHDTFTAGKNIVMNSLRTPIKYIITQFLASDFYIPINKTNINDIFIVGFPKSGNTWMQSLIAGIQYGIDTN